MPLSPGGFVAPPPLLSLTDRSKGSSSSRSCRLGERRDSRESSDPSEPTSF